MKKLNQKGFAHWIVPVVVMILVALIGVRVLTGSHADNISQTTPPNTFKNQYLTISPDTGTIGFVHGNHNTSIIPSGFTFNPDNLYQVGFTIADKKALQYKLNNFTGGENGGFFNPSGNLTPNQSTNVLVFISPDISDGTYTFTGQLSYLVSTPNQKVTTHWRTGPTINLTINVSGQPYLDFISVQPLGVNETLSKANASPTSGLILGQPIFVTAQVPSGYEVQYTQPTQGQGFYQSSGGLYPHETAQLQTYINASKPNGLYQGQAIIQYMNDKGQWLNGPTVSYSINLTN